MKSENLFVIKYKLKMYSHCNSKHNWNVWKYKILQQSFVELFLVCVNGNNEAFSLRLRYVQQTKARKYRRFTLYKIEFLVLDLSFCYLKVPLFTSLFALCLYPEQSMDYLRLRRRSHRECMHICTQGCFPSVFVLAVIGLV